MASGLSHKQWEGEDPRFMLTLGGLGPGLTWPWGTLAGELVPPPLEEAGHGQEKAADDSAKAEPQRTVDQGQLISTQLQPWKGCKTAVRP